MVSRNDRRQWQTHNHKSWNKSPRYKELRTTRKRGVGRHES